MRTTLQNNFGPTSTPKVVQSVILATTLITLVLALTEGLFHYLTGITSLATFLSLSYTGVMNGLIWQPATYFFVYNTLGYGITLALIISLAFQMYLLWISGSVLTERLGAASFLTIYLTAGILSGLVALATMALTGSHPILSGAAAPLLAILIAWIMLYPDTEFLLFFTFPFKASWMIFGYLGIALLISLSHLDLVDFFHTLTSAAVGYLYMTIVWEQHSPFNVTQRIDVKLNALGRFLHQHPSREIDNESKIVPLHPDQAKDGDEAFLDAMLTKISEYGEASLTWRERRRLHRISKEKQRK